jgi:hypothetical protein
MEICDRRAVLKITWRECVNKGKGNRQKGRAGVK